MSFNLDFWNWEKKNLKNKDKMKIYSNIQKLKEFITETAML